MRVHYSSSKLGSRRFHWFIDQWVWLEFRWSLPTADRTSKKPRNLIRSVSALRAHFELASRDHFLFEKASRQFGGFEYRWDLRYVFDYYRGLYESFVLAYKLIYANIVFHIPRVFELGNYVHRGPNSR